jgi:hypothetical protein
MKAEWNASSHGLPSIALDESDSLKPVNGHKLRTCRVAWNNAQDGKSVPPGYAVFSMESSVEAAS